MPCHAHAQGVHTLRSRDTLNLVLLPSPQTFYFSQSNNIILRPECQIIWSILSPSDSICVRRYCTATWGRHTLLRASQCYLILRDPILKQFQNTKCRGTTPPFLIDISTISSQWHPQLVLFLDSIFLTSFPVNLSFLSASILYFISTSFFPRLFAKAWEPASHRSKKSVSSYNPLSRYFRREGSISQGKEESFLVIVSVPVAIRKRTNSCVHQISIYLTLSIFFQHMAIDRIFATFLGVELLFVVGGIIILVFALVTQANAKREFTVDTVARDLLLQDCPIRGKQPLPPQYWYNMIF